ncbi:MAG: CinA family protein [Parvularculaceae bacterium]
MRHPSRIWSLAQQIVDKAGAEGLMAATAESCTGGLVAAAITDVPGSSAVFDRAFVTYSNEAKTEMLGVSPATIARSGAVSQATARAMAEGALRHSRADIAVAVTGIAGPAGGSERKPVGLVWFALAAKGKPTRAERRVFADGDRGFVRMRAAETALMLLLRAM